MKHLVKLKDIASYSKGTQINGDDLANDAEYKYLNGGINPSGKWKEANCMANTVTISEGGNSCGYVNYMTEPFWCGAHCYYIYDTIKNTQYLYYALKSQQDRIMELRSGACMPNIKKGDLGNFKFIIDDDSYEQEKISTVLGKLEKLKRVREYELIELNNLVRGRFVELFGDVSTETYKYETRRLGEVANVGSSHRVFTTEFVDKGVPFYRGTEIGELAKGNKPTEPFYISEEHYNRLANDDTKPKVGDLLMPSICNKGQVWMVDTDKPFYYKDGRVLCISPNREFFNTKYFEHFMRIKTLVEYPKLGSGSTFAEFKIFMLKGIDVLVPPIELQNQFADFAHQVDKSKFRGFSMLTTMKSAYEQQTLIYP